jgi:hypothetical protein
LYHLQHKLIGFYNQDRSVYSAVRTGSLNKVVCASALKGSAAFCQQNAKIREVPIGEGDGP